MCRTNSPWLPSPVNLHRAIRNFIICQGVGREVEYHVEDTVAAASITPWRQPCAHLLSNASFIALSNDNGKLA